MSSSKKKKRKIYLKRIISDIADLVSDPVENIHIWYDEENITSIKALIIGPKDTPYQDGFYFFSLKFPETYPFTNPSAKFETINQKIRFNPNLYEGGKVCLSILGTWSGPKWSSVQTLKSVLLSIQSLLNEQPIINEPGWENTSNDDDKAIQYNEYIKYHNYEFAILYILEHEDFFPYFNKIVQKYFVENYQRLIDNITAKKTLDGNIVKTFIWNHSVKLDYSSLLIKYQHMYNKLTAELSEKEPSDLSQTSPSLDHLKKQSIEKNVNI